MLLTVSTQHSQGSYGWRPGPLVTPNPQSPVLVECDSHLECLSWLMLASTIHGDRDSSEVRTGFAMSGTALRKGHFKGDP